MTFTQEFYIQSTTYYGDVPLWSLSYEAAYYLLFGLAFYLKGAQRTVAVILSSLIIGPKIILLAPVWFAGWAIYHWRAKLALFFESGAKPLLLASFLPYAVYVIGHQAIDDAVLDFFRRFGLNVSRLRFSYHFATDYMLALLVCGHLIAVRALITDEFSWGKIFSAISAWLADRSFAIYLFHFPLLYFIAAMLGDARHGFLGGVVMFVGALGGSALLAVISDLRKREWRIFFEALWSICANYRRPVAAATSATEETAAAEP
jgi:peptidoglycan/LPS O-acetylase OafA/YrhL